MRYFERFLNIWNRVPLYPSFSLNFEEKRVECKKNYTGKFRLTILIFIFEICLVTYVNWGDITVELFLSIFASLCNLWSAFCGIFTFYLRRNDMEKNLTTLYNLSDKYSKKMHDGDGRNLRLSILNIFVQVAVTFLLVLSELMMQFTNDPMFGYYDTAFIYSSSIIDILFQTFYLFTGFTQLALMMNNLSYIQTNHRTQDVKAACKFSSISNKNSEDFFNLYSIPLLNRCGFAALAITMDLYEAFETLWLTKGESFVIFTKLLFFFIDFLIELYVLSIFLHVASESSNKSKQAVEVIYDIQQKIGRKNLPYKSMELFLLNSKLNELKVSVCGLFPLDWTLIYSMVAGIATYLVYLIQFREMELGKTES